LVKKSKKLIVESNIVQKLQNILTALNLAATKAENDFTEMHKAISDKYIEDIALNT